MESPRDNIAVIASVFDLYHWPGLGEQTASSQFVDDTKARSIVNYEGDNSNRLQWDINSQNGHMDGMWSLMFRNMSWCILSKERKEDNDE